MNRPASSSAGKVGTRLWSAISERIGGRPTIGRPQVPRFF